jgi:hypothetical protein
MNFARAGRVSAAVTSTLLMATLAACGGGGGGGGGSTPPSNPPSGNPPAPTLSRLTLTGTVTDAPIANAVVTATIGTETFTVEADANGNYSLTIEIPESAAAGFVTLSARGVGEQSYVEFTSLAGTFSSLQAQAGDDQTLTNTENFATQITNVSTALAVLLQEANGGEPVTSEAQLNTLVATLNSQEVLDLATAIKLVVDDPVNYPMPDGDTSLLALLADGAARQQFVDQAYEQDPAIFESTQSAIVNDSALTQPVSNETLPTQITAAMLSDASDFSFNYFNRVNSYTFNADGTGVAAAGSWNTEMTWAIEGTSVEVAYTAPVETQSYDIVDCDGTPRQVLAIYRSEGVRLNLLSDRVLAITETNDISYPEPGDCSNLEAHQSTTTVARTILNDGDFQELTADDLADSTQTLYVYDEFAGVTADVADLNANGTGSTWAFGKQFTWEIDDSGRVVVATFDDGTVARYRALASTDFATTDLFYEIETPSGRRVDAGASVYADPELPLAFTSANVPGRYYQFGIGLEGGGDPRLKSFRLRFDADGTGAQEDDFIDENDQVVTLNELNTPWYRFHWNIDGEDLVVQRTFDVAVEQEGCPPGAADCIVYDERRIVPLAKDGARVYWMEYRRFDSFGITENTVPTTLVRFYDYEPLDAAAFLYGKSVVGSAGSARKLRFRGTAQR